MNPPDRDDEADVVSKEKLLVMSAFETNRRRYEELQAQTRKLHEEMDEVRRTSRELRERSRTLIHASRLLREADKKCIIKTCTCGKTYRPSEWLQLPLVGWQTTKAIGGEMRNCSCESTLLVITHKERAA